MVLRSDAQPQSKADLGLKFKLNKKFQFNEKKPELWRGDRSSDAKVVTVERWHAGTVSDKSAKRKKLENEDGRWEKKEGEQRKRWKIRRK